jgi:hypothetical protein
MKHSPTDRPKISHSHATFLLAIKLLKHFPPRHLPSLVLAAPLLILMLPTKNIQKTGKTSPKIPENHVIGIDKKHKVCYNESAHGSWARPSGPVDV